jgi:ABC-type transport system substrate-binding protein
VSRVRDFARIAIAPRPPCPWIVIMPGILPLSNRFIGRIALLPVILLPLFVAACADDAPPPRGGTVTVVTSSDLGTALPLLAASTMDHDLRMILFRPLLQDWWEDGRLHHLTHAENPAALARSWEYVGTDSAAIRFHLVTDARWSDGEPITAHDAAWTLEMRGHPETGSPRADYSRRIVSVEAEDDHTLLVRFDRRYAEMLFHATESVVPRHAFRGTEAGGVRSHPAVADPAAHLPVSGAFVIERWDRGREIVLTPNPHFEPAPRVDRIVFRVVPEESSRLVELQTGVPSYSRGFLSAGSAAWSGRCRSSGSSGGRAATSGTSRGTRRGSNPSATRGCAGRSAWRSTTTLC